MFGLHYVLVSQADRQPLWLLVKSEGFHSGRRGLDSDTKTAHTRWAVLFLAGGTRITLHIHVLRPCGVSVASLRCSKSLQAILVEPRFSSSPPKTITAHTRRAVMVLMAGGLGLLAPSMALAASRPTLLRTVVPDRSRRSWSNPKDSHPSPRTNTEPAIKAGSVFVHGWGTRIRT